MFVSTRRVAAICLATLAASLAAPGPAAAAKAAPAKATIAVLAFDYGGSNAELGPLREGLAQMLISDLATLPELQVVERAKLNALLAEQKLGRSGAVDPATAARIGKLLGAQYLVLGNFFDLANTLRFDARVVDVETGRVLKAAGMQGPAADVWGLEQKLAERLGEILQGSLPGTSRRPAGAVPASRPKVRSGTVAEYGRALLALDRGERGQAKTLLTKVVADAPEFTLAKSDLNALMQ